jgi:hypothetical protein
VSANVQRLPVGHPASRQLAGEISINAFPPGSWMEVKSPGEIISAVPQYGYRFIGRGRNNFRFRNAVLNLALSRVLLH